MFSILSMSASFEPVKRREIWTACLGIWRYSWNGKPTCGVKSSILYSFRDGDTNRGEAALHFGAVGPSGEAADNKALYDALLDFWVP